MIRKTTLVQYTHNRALLHLLFFLALSFFAFYTAFNGAFSTLECDFSLNRCSKIDRNLLYEIRHQTDFNLSDIKKVTIYEDPDWKDLPDYTLYAQTSSNLIALYDGGPFELNKIVALKNTFNAFLKHQAVNTFTLSSNLSFGFWACLAGGLGLFFFAVWHYLDFWINPPQHPVIDPFRSERSQQGYLED